MCQSKCIMQSKYFSFLFKATWMKFFKFQPLIKIFDFMATYLFQKLLENNLLPIKSLQPKSINLISIYVYYMSKTMSRSCAKSKVRRMYIKLE